MSPGPGAELLRVVIDTNIYISAFQFPRGRNAALWKAAREQRYQLVVSPEILRETARVLRDDFKWQEERVQLAVRRIADVARLGLVAVRTAVRAVLADPDDDHVIACAVDGNAGLIVSNDRHLLNLKEYAGIPIIASVDFRRILGLK